LPMSRGNFDAISESHISHFCNPKGLPYKYCNIVSQGFNLAICKYKCLPKIHNSTSKNHNSAFLTFLTILTFSPYFLTFHLLTLLQTQRVALHLYFCDLN
jgi:hypothetical protein